MIAICLVAFRKIALPPGGTASFGPAIERAFLPVPAEPAGVPVRGVVPGKVMST
jgi:hypothetical protein